MPAQDKLEQTVARLLSIAREEASVAFANSLGAEDMVLTDLIARHALPFTVFSLDTGRLPEETYALMQRVREHYPGFTLRVLSPDAADVEAWVARYGVNGFYDSADARKGCCEVRKLAPLKRALSGHSAWLTGLRRAQSVTRDALPESAFDEANGLMKYNPLFDWSEAEVWAYLKENGVPYNALHDRHYPSIGCAPCTRAISVGEDVRSGRWWWENPASRECGLHVKVLTPLTPR